MGELVVVGDDLEVRLDGIAGVVRIVVVVGNDLVL